MSDFEFKNLARIRAALDHHNSTCPVPAKAILLNPVDHGLLLCDELWGLPVQADDRVPVKRIRIACDGSAWECEKELAELVSNGASDDPSQVEAA